MNNGNGKTTNSHIGSMIIGAAIGAAAVTLVNKDSRKKVKDGIKNALDRSDEKMDELSGRAENLKKKAKSRAIKELRSTERKLAAGA